MIGYRVYMAVPISASKAHKLFAEEGVQVKTFGQWADHNRNHKGSWGPVHGVMIHHTGPARAIRNMVNYCYNGDSRRDLPGPLCHGVIDKDGSLHLVGWGRANHAGLGDASVLRAVIAESSLPKPRFQTVDGNARFYGLECFNNGDGKDEWPDAQLEGMARTAAALCRAHNWNGASVIGHKEWTSQKPDPRGVDMDKLRHRVDQILG